MTRTRFTLYLRPVKDADILTFVNPLLKHEEFSAVIRSLVRDGISFRKGSLSEKVFQSNTTKITSVKLEKKEVSTDELEDRLDNF